MTHINRLFLLALTVTAVLASPQAFASRNAGTDALEFFPETAPSGLQPKESESMFSDAEFKAVNWAQPPLGCVEEMVPHRADRPCLDLSAVASPLKDWPERLSPEDKQYWYSQRRGLDLCRAEEVLRREKASPGSQSAGVLELSTMTVDSVNHSEEKIDAIYEASRTYGVPQQVLTGAVYQESLFSELGIAEDGGNFSCGVEQINLFGWCGWMNKQSDADKQAMGWPTQRMNCEDSNTIKLSLFKPVYEIAKARLAGKPEYLLHKEHFANIPLSSFVSQWPAAAPEVQQLRYQLITSYINNCSEPRKGILAKANELADIYGMFVPEGLKAKDHYSGSDRFKRSCKEVQGNNVYPLHAGWLLAVASYNAGPRAVDAVAHYNQWSPESAANPAKLANFTPNDIVTSLYWGGKYNPSNDMIEFNSLNNGSPRSWTWFKGCVAQRHVARVMQHVTLLPEFFVDSLEGNSPCARSTVDSSGHLVQTSVPLPRQTSSGVDPNAPPRVKRPAPQPQPGGWCLPFFGCR